MQAEIACDLGDRATGLEDEASAAIEQLRRVLPRSWHGS